MRNNGKYCLTVLNHANHKVLRVSLPYSGLCACVLFAIVSMVGAVTAICHAGRMVLKGAEYNHLLAENDSFRSENDQLRIQSAELEEKIDFLETLATKLKAMSGLSSYEGLDGAGRSRLENPALSQADSTGGLPAMEDYNKSVSDLEGRFRNIDLRFSEKQLVQSARPDRMPVLGYVTCGLGRREDPLDGTRIEHHSGLDISAPYGSPVRAPADGIVIYAGQMEGYGNLVVIDHRFGYVTRYGHLSRMAVEAGQHVLRSEVIGFVGTSGRTTGPHLHYELWWNNILINPMRLLARNR